MTVVSACRCPPCRQFTPLLKQAYDAINTSSKRLEIVFVSSDPDEEQFEVLHHSQQPARHMHDHPRPEHGLTRLAPMPI